MSQFNFPSAKTPRKFNSQHNIDCKRQNTAHMYKIYIDKYLGQLWILVLNIYIGNGEVRERGLCPRTCFCINTTCPQYCSRKCIICVLMSSQNSTPSTFSLLAKLLGLPLSSLQMLSQLTDFIIWLHLSHLSNLFCPQSCSLLFRQLLFKPVSSLLELWFNLQK